MMGASDITYSSHSRANGCTCPLHGYQFIAWGCFLYFALFYFMTTVPHILDELQPIAYVILAIFLIVHLIVHLLASCINPADPNVLKKMKQGHRSVGSFNRSEHRHVIENQHCYLCEVDVGVKSKHCSTCNKCVADFDHHCKWLNNCVGGRNYRLFIATLCTAISGTLVIFVTCLVQFVAYYTDKENGDVLKPYHDIFVDSMSDGALFMASLLPTTQADVTNPEFQLFYITVPDLAWQIMTMFTTVLAALATGLMGHLLGFHIYLMCKNLSTYDYIIREREKSEQRAREQDVDERSPDMNRSKNRPNKIQPNDGEMQAKHQSRSTWAVLGGIDEYAIVETAQLSGETPPPVHTPPLSVRNHSHHGAIPTLSQQISHEAGHTRRKKKRSKHLSSSAEYPAGLSNTLPLSPGNSIRTPVNGHLPTLDDSQELMERIRHSQDDDQMAEGMSREGPIPSSAVQQIGFSMRRKQKMHSRQEAVFSSAATSGTDDAGCTATDSGCDLENGSLVNLQAKPSKSPDLSSRQCNCEPQLISSVEQTHSSVDSYSSRYSRTNHLQNNVAVERLDLPHSSDSDYDGSNSKEKGHLPVYGQRAFNTDSNVYRTLPAISTHLVNNPRNKPAYNGMGSSESLHEIPVSCTQHGRRHANKHHSGGFHSYGPEIGVPVPRRPKRNRHKDSSKHGIVNHGAKLNENSSTSDEDAEGEGVLMAPHGVCYGNSVTHTVEIYSDRTPRPPRHKDVPPLDLSALHHDSDTDHTKRTNKSNRHEQASKI